MTDTTYALLRSVAMLPIVTMCVGQAGHTGIDALTAEKWRRARIGVILTAESHMAGFGAVTVQSIGTGSVDREVVACVIGFVTGIRGTGNSVIAIRRRAGLARPTQTHFSPVAVQRIGTNVRVVRSESTASAGSTSVVRTGVVVVAVVGRDLDIDGVGFLAGDIRTQIGHSDFDRRSCG